MITGPLKNKIDKLWLEFWQGGIANPLTVIEQITFLMFSRLLDINETRDDRVRPWRHVIFRRWREFAVGIDRGHGPLLRAG